MYKTFRIKFLETNEKSFLNFDPIVLYPIYSTSTRSASDESLKKQAYWTTIITRLNNSKKRYISNKSSIQKKKEHKMIHGLQIRIWSRNTGTKKK